MFYKGREAYMGASKKKMRATFGVLTSRDETTWEA
jgi:hypothetical protein